MPEFRPPRPGLRGDYTGTCVLCFRGTDTAFGVEGTAGWHMAGLVKLGLSHDHAVETNRMLTGCDPGKVPVGRYLAYVRLCASCADSVGAQVGLLAADEPMPTMVQPHDETPGDDSSVS